MHAPSTKQISGESNIVEMLLINLKEIPLAANALRSHRLCSKYPARPTSVCAVTVCAPYTTAMHPRRQYMRPVAKQISGESNIVEMLLQSPALLQHATATGAGPNTAM